MSRRIMALAVATSAMFGVARADTIILTADVWCPHNCEEDAPRRGYVVDLVRAALEPMGHRVEYRVRPWLRAIKEAEMGVSTAVIGVMGEEMTARTVRSGAVGVIDLAFATRFDSKWTWNGVDSLSGRRLAVGDYDFPAGVGAYVAAHPKDVFVVRGDSPMERALRRLDLGDVTVVLDDRAVLREAARRADLPIRFAGDLERIPLMLGFMKSDPDAETHARAVDEGVARIRASGELARILAVYGVEDWEKPAAKR